MNARLAWRWMPAGLFLLGMLTHFARLLSAPPGISGDAARLGLYTLDFLQNQLWPFYVYHQFGPQPLILYFQAPVFVVFGYTLPALRGVTAFASALAVPLLYIAAGEMFAAPPIARRAGLMAALGLALSPFWTQFAHQGIEPALMPLMELLTVALLWRGLRRKRWSGFLAAGIGLGLSQYTYITARFFPIALAVACLLAIVAEPGLLRAWPGFGLTALTAAAIAAPQWYVFMTEPYTFFARTEQLAGQFIWTQPEVGTLLPQKLINQLLMLGIRWEAGIYNPFSGRPLLNAALFAGFLAAVRAILRGRRAPQVFTVTMALALLAPDLISYEGLQPSATRLSVAIPFIFLLAGLGCASLWVWLEKRTPSYLAAVIIVGAVLAAGFEEQWDFGQRVLPQAYQMDGLEWRTSLVEIAEADFITAHHDEKILIPTSEVYRAPLGFLLAEHYPVRAGGYPAPLAAGEAVLVIRPDDPNRATTEGIPAGYVPDEWVLLDQGQMYFMPPIPGSLVPLSEEEILSASNGARVARAFHATWAGASAPFTPLDTVFENGMQLRGYHVSDFVPGRPLRVTLFWQLQRRLDHDVELFTQVLTPEGAYYVGVHAWPLHGAYRVRAWEPGEMVPLSYTFDIPADAPPGTYSLTTGVFHLTRRQRIPVVNGPDMTGVTVFTVGQ